MIMETVTYPSSNGVDTIYASLWAEENIAYKGVVQIVHGMCEYVERYTHWAQALAKEGFIVCGEDHLGHGRTGQAGENGFGYFAKQDGWNFLVEDVHTLRKQVGERFPTLPYFILGHSMGSFISRVYGTRYGQELKGMILSGTAGMGRDTTALREAVGVYKALRGEHHQSETLMQLVFKGYNARYPEKRTDSDWISRDAQVVDTYRQDPWCIFAFTISGFEDLATLIGLVSQSEWPKLMPKELPIYLYAGDMDPVGAYGEGVKQTACALEQAGVMDVQLRLYPEGRHEMHNELNREEVLGHLIGWLEGHLN